MLTNRMESGSGMESGSADEGPLIALSTQESHHFYYSPDILNGALEGGSANSDSYGDYFVKVESPEVKIGETPSFAFKPDDWSRVFQEGFGKYDFNGKRVLEVGVGTGINIIKILINNEVLEIIGSDLEPNVVELAYKNVINHSQNPHKFQAVESNLLRNINSDFLGKVDYIIACIPQAILPKGAKKSDDDTAHYYPGEYFEQYPFNKLALGLNEALLSQVRETSKQARVLLNLAGRVGKKNLFEMFQSNGFTPKVQHEEIVPQCPSTSLDFFVKLEEKGFSDCTFSSDPNGKKLITAEKAEHRRINNDEVYHPLHAIEGKFN